MQYDVCLLGISHFLTTINPLQFTNNFFNNIIPTPMIIQTWFDLHIGLLNYDCMWMDALTLEERTSSILIVILFSKNYGTDLSDCVVP